MAKKIEICAGGLGSALAAQRAGAQRIELCAALDCGGLSPSHGLLQAVLEATELPVHVLIRPREGGFCYDGAELALMLADIRHCRALGASGVVIGAALPDGRLDLPAMQAMQEAAGPLDCTCHRVFDATPDPFEALEQLVALGFARVLSSGQRGTALEGMPLLRDLVALAQDRIVVMPGAGITAANIAQIARETGASEFHLSAKAWQQEPGRSLPGLATGHWRSDEAQIRQALSAMG
jgi:copper homeostasis protein